MVLAERDTVGGNTRIKETAGRGFDGGFDGEGDQVVFGERSLGGQAGDGLG